MSNRSLAELSDLATKTCADAPVLKPYLPPNAVAVQFANGDMLARAGVPINTVMEANAAQRVLYERLRQGKTLEIQSVAVAGGLPLADLMTLAAYAAPDGRLLVNGQTVPLHRSLLPFGPRQQAERRTNPQRGYYALRCHGTAVDESGRTVDLSALGDYPAFRLLRIADPTDLTPVRAMVADWHTRFRPRSWDVACIQVQGQLRDGTFPLSGRDVQVLRRELAGGVVIHWMRPGQGVEVMLLDDLMPGAYQSNHTHIQTPDAFWRDTPENQLGVSAGDLHRMQAALAVCAATAPVQPPRVTAVLLENGEIVTGSHLPLLQLNVPSCAEANALRAAAGQKIAAVLIQIHENHADTPLLGPQAAPCGFCREHIMACCPPQTPVILTDGHGRYQQARAKDLLKYHTECQSQPVTVVADSDDLWMQAKSLSQGMHHVPTATAFTSNGLVMAAAAPYISQPDCFYPPMIGQRLQAIGEQAEAYLLYSPKSALTGQIGAYQAVWLAKSARDLETRVMFADRWGIQAEASVSDLLGTKHFPLPELHRVPEFVTASTFNHQPVISRPDMGR